MLAQKYRLRGDRKFREIFQKGSYFFTPLFNLKYLENNKAVPRFAVVISAKTSKIAPHRNRARRQLFEIIRHNLKGFNKNFDYVVVVKKPFLKMSSSEKEKALQAVFKRIKL